MALTRNIDSRGRAVRLISGLLVLVVGVVLLFLWALSVGSALGWTITTLCLLCGAFMVFEARAGWCCLRALGMKTPV